MTVKRIGVRLSEEALSNWTAYCRAQGEHPSTAIRQHIESTLEREASKGVKSPKRTRKPRRDQVKRRVTVELTESEIEGIRLRTQMRGGTRASWIISLIRSALTVDPQLGDAEMEALVESNYQLLSIGRNLNQISRRLNEGQKQQQVELAMVESLRDQIDLHAASVERMILANRERWAIE